MPSLSMSALQRDYPWTSYPLVAAAPMRLITLAPLAVEASKAGGLGFIGTGEDLSTLDRTLDHAASLVREDQTLSHVYGETGVLPVGFGVLNWGANLDLAVAAVEKWTPAAVWLFAPYEMHHLTGWTSKLRLCGKRKTKIWIQVGTVTDALSVAKTCDPDVIVVQGHDAGGHGLERGASIVTLLPEVKDCLRSHGLNHISLVAAGGIGDGRGVAASLVLGAEGVALGTRLLATPQAEIPKGYQNAVLKAKDGGVSTIRTKIYDQLRGTTEWPRLYGGRGVINQSFLDYNAGLCMEENKKLYEEHTKLGDSGFGLQGRLTTYAGTVVGLVKSVKDAGDVVQEVRQDALKCLQEAVLSFPNPKSHL
ncbi:MAG: hypothetical protein Q9227_000852 [Pyrenula ochraceoflavens]